MTDEQINKAIAGSKHNALAGIAIAFRWDILMVVRRSERTPTRGKDHG
jgi:hypothetical protein